MPQRKAVPMIISINMNLKKNKCHVYNVPWIVEMCRCIMQGAKWKGLLPHHIINHLPYGDLQSSQRLVGWQNVRQPCEAQHASHCKQHLWNQLGVLLMPVFTYCGTVSHNRHLLTAFNTSNNHYGLMIWHYFLTSLSEVDTLLCTVSIRAEDVTFEHDEHT